MRVVSAHDAFRLKILWSKRTGFRPPAQLVCMNAGSNRLSGALIRSEIWIGLPDSTIGHYDMEEKAGSRYQTRIALTRLVANRGRVVRFARYALRLMHDAIIPPDSFVQIDPSATTGIEKRVMEISTQSGAHQLIEPDQPLLIQIQTCWFAYEFRTNHRFFNNRAHLSFYLFC